MKIQVIKYDEVLNFKMRRVIGHLREQMLAKGLFLDFYGFSNENSVCDPIEKVLPQALGSIHQLNHACS